jgi:uncharacterized membrane protein
MLFGGGKAALPASFGFTTVNDPNGFATAARGINTGGKVVGYFFDAAGIHGFLDTGGAFTTIDDPNATPGNTFAFGINSGGQVVGQFVDATGPHGWSAFTTINAPHAKGADGRTTAFGITPVGQIVGQFFDATGTLHGFLVTPTTTPEPGILTLLSSGLIGLAAAFGRK